LNEYPVAFAAKSVHDGSREVAVTQGLDEPLSQTFISQGLKLHYVDWGNEGAPCLLLIHGIRDHARSWDWVARALRGKWRIIAPDLRGHGDSQWSPDGAYLSPYHVLDIVDLIATLGYEKLTIVGHSYGGNIASRFAAIYPSACKKAGAR
jgi:pimeloyl-ACP methyl ester carboxylesterase